jgi:hypothetical protein
MQGNCFCASEDIADSLLLYYRPLHKTKSGSPGYIVCFPANLRLCFNQIYNMVSVVICLNLFKELILVHFQKYRLLRGSKVVGVKIHHPTCRDLHSLKNLVSAY